MTLAVHVHASLPGASACERACATRTCDSRRCGGRACGRRWGGRRDCRLCRGGRQSRRCGRVCKAIKSRYGQFVATEHGPRCRNTMEFVAPCRFRVATCRFRVATCRFMLRHVELCGNKECVARMNMRDQCWSLTRFVRTLHSIALQRGVPCYTRLHLCFPVATSGAPLGQSVAGRCHASHGVAACCSVLGWNTLHRGSTCNRAQPLPLQTRYGPGAHPIVHHARCIVYAVRGTLSRRRTTAPWPQLVHAARLRGDAADGADRRTADFRLAEYGPDLSWSCGTQYKGGCPEAGRALAFSGLRSQLQRLGRGSSRW
jgi:hypothetical protein